MVTRRRFLTLGGLSATVTVLAACGAVPAAAPTEAKPKVEAPAAPAVKAAPKEVVELTIYEYHPRTEAMVAPFNEKFAGRYKLRAVIIPTAEYIAKILSQLAADVPPDIFMLWQQYKPEWVDRGLILDVTDRIKSSQQIKPDMYFEPVMAMLERQGRLWGTPMQYNAMILYLQEDYFKAAGINIPPDDWTMQDYREIAKRLTNPEKGIFGSTNWPFFTGAIAWTNFMLLWNWGKHFWLDGTETKSLVNSQSSIAMHKFFQDMAFADRSVPSPLNPQKQGQGTRDGYFAMWESWTNEHGWLREHHKNQPPPFNYTFHTFPKGPADQRHIGGGHLWSIPKSHKRPDDPWVVAEFMSGTEGWRHWVKVTKAQPPTIRDREVWENWYDYLPADTRKKMVDFVLNRLYSGLAIDFQYWVGYDQCAKIMAEAMQKMFGKDQADVAQTLNTAAQQMNAAMEEVRKQQQQK